MKKPIVPLQSKTDDLRQAWERGDKIGALRIASKFFDRSPETKVFQRGWDAHKNASFYQQLGKNPEALVSEALSAMSAKFNLG